LKEKAQLLATISETEPLSALPPVAYPGMICGPPVVTAPKIIPGKHSVMNTSSPPVCTQSTLQGRPSLSTPFQRTLVQPPPMPACSTFVPPPVPAHVIPPPGVGMSAKSFGTSVVPALPPVVQAVPSMLMSATPTIPSVPNVTSLTQSLNVGTNVTFCTGTSMITANMSGACSSSSASLTQIVGDTLTQHSQTVEVLEPANATKPITTTTPVQIKSTDESLHTVGVPAPTSVGLVQTASAPVVVVKQPQPTKSYSGQSSYKKYKEYFTRLAQCNGWTTGVKKAQNLLMEGAAAEAMRGLTANQESDYLGGFEP